LNQHRFDFFGKSAPYYDTILDLLTFKQYAGFQKRAMEVLAPQSGEKILDLCSGTGRVASWMATAVGDTGEVVGLDITESMVKIAKERYGGLKNLIFLQRDATKPWEYQNYFDGIFTSFALLSSIKGEGKNGDRGIQSASIWKGENHPSRFFQTF
jgi:demethylmenaquinone methyltransferase/2-methoxy-6-polyprenyl-1,4-benzoquinol methylase